jgi:UDP-glucose 4-epimerase
MVWSQFLDTFVDHGLAKNTRIILLSSGGCTYDGMDSPFKESAPSSGINEYGRFKISMERELQSRDINWIIFRISNAFGPNQLLGRGQGVVAEWADKIKKGEKIPIIGSLDSYRDYIYISDIAGAIVEALSLPNLSGIYNLGSGIGTSLRELLAILSKITGKELEYTHRPARISDRAGYFLDINKIKTDLGWEPKVNIEEGLRRSLS